MRRLREDRMTGQAKPSIWFWIIGVIALLWNIMGLGAYFQQFMMSAESFAALRPEQQQMLVGQPFWLTGAFATAVFAGFIGSIALLLRKPIAVRLFLLSMIAVFIQFGGLFLAFDYANVLIGGEWVMPILVPVIAVGLYLYARRSEQNRILT
ncbi:Sugar transporter [Parasphingorhabdus sp. NYA22]